MWSVWSMGVLVTMTDLGEDRVYCCCVMTWAVLGSRTGASEVEINLYKSSTVHVFMTESHQKMHPLRIKFCSYSTSRAALIVQATF